MKGGGRGYGRTLSASSFLSIPLQDGEDRVVILGLSVIVVEVDSADPLARPEIRREFVLLQSLDLIPSDLAKLLERELRLWRGTEVRWRTCPMPD